MNSIETSIQDAAATECGNGDCPACGYSSLEIFYRVEGVPTNSCILLSSADEARNYPTGDVELSFCSGCGFVFNSAFDMSLTEYSGRYEETQAYSNTFNRFHLALAERLIKRHELYGKNILEIGCGKGEFLTLLAELGNNWGVGIDPGVDVRRIEGPAAERLTFIADLYSEAYGAHPVDFLACKMTLEHIAEPAEFVSTVRRGLGGQTGARVFFQVPETLRILSECAFEDIYYEHCAYFSPGSLGRLFRRAGFDVTDIAIEYADQYLTLEACPRPDDALPSAPLPIEDDLDVLRHSVATFPNRVCEKLTYWRAIISETIADDKSIVLWGSGSKAVSFLTTLGVGDMIEYVTDINPNRHNHFMPVTGQRIIPPTELPQIDPGLVICMNRIYETEIGEELSRMGLSPRILSL